ncbi:MAG TPA: glucose-6-phosphate dehydrogenase assembly protein OpcA [Thermoanaerobaculia bacterium]|jgi:glucose-6-phosphate dehydrogenase assembly protein OpcA|nr:glucose-6-phosphate dehydrogenase assembly protein OpcA [Thermoanaerobaculia bacterium]
MDGLRVDVSTIEKQLAERWRAEIEEGALTKAALWNVVAHTWTSQQHAHAAEVLSRASASVPQRTIVVQADPEGRAEISSFISANCHLVAGGRQLCSEEVSIVASGDRVDHVPPLVSALLLPDMPVAVWWLGDLPRDLHYAEVLLDPADRLIFDSSHFDGHEDLDFVTRIADQTTTAPADLNWARIEEWRAATAALFDPAPMRERLQMIRSIRVFSGGGTTFGASSEALLYVAWMIAQTGRELDFEFVSEGEEAGIAAVEIVFDDNSIASMRGDRDRRVVISTSDGSEAQLDCVTRSLARNEADLIVRLLKRPEADRVYLKSLRVARRLAK